MTLVGNTFSVIKLPSLLYGSGLLLFPALFDELFCWAPLVTAAPDGVVVTAAVDDELPWDDCPLAWVESTGLTTGELSLLFLLFVFAFFFVNESMPWSIFV